MHSDNDFALLSPARFLNMKVKIPFPFLLMFLSDKIFRQKQNFLSG